MERRIRLPNRHERTPAPQVRRQRVRDAIRELLDHAIEEGPHGSLDEALGEPVHRDDAPHVKRGVLALLHGFELRILYRQGSLRARHDLPIEHHALPALEDLSEVRLVEPEPQEKAGVIAEEDLERCTRPTPGRERDPDDGAAGRLGVPDAKPTKRHQLTAILVPSRKPVEGILDGVELESCQQSGPLGADALEVLQGRVRT
jgi:hypothetical protein